MATTTYIKDIDIISGGSTTSYLIEPALYGTASTNDSGSTYTVTMPAGFTLITGATIQVKFAATNAVNATLKVNTLDAKSIYYNNEQIAASTFKANHVYTLVYDGSKWQVVGDIDTNTQLSIGTGANQAAAGNHGHGNITNDGALATANQAVVTDGNNKITTEDLSSSTPAASGTATAFVTGVTQNAKGKLTSITKANLPTASDSVAGITKLGATGGAATYGHTHGNINNNGTIGTANAIRAVVTNASNQITTDNFAQDSPTVPTSGTTTSLEFIDTVSQGASGKITATKKKIPNVSKDTAGLAPKGAAVSTQSQSTKFLREDGSWAAPTYTSNTDQKVKQNANTENKEYSILLKTTDDATGETGEVKFGATTNKLVTINPSTGKITAPGGLAGDASSVNGHTVLTDVPANAVFTDTKSFTITANATDGYWNLTGTNGTNAVTYALAPYSSKQSGANFYTGTTNPDGTTRLNYNGYLYATKLYSGGTEVSVSGHTHSYLPLSGGTLTGTLTLSNNVGLNFKDAATNSDTFISFTDADNTTVKLGIRRPLATYGLTYYDGTNYKLIAHAGNIVNDNINLSRNTETTIATIAGVAIKIKLPASDNTNTASAVDNILDGSNSGTAITYAPYSSQQSKLSFDTSSTAPSRTDRLNLNGYLYATKLYSGGTEVSVSGHTHSYAGSSSAGGAATTATTTANTTDEIYILGVKSGATTTLLHDTKITATGGKLMLTGGGLEIKGHIAGDGGTAGHGLYSGGVYHNAYNNIILHGDATTGSSGIAFVSDKVAADGTVTNINQPSDRAFIQYHAYGVTTATAEGTAPTLATSGEAGRLVIGIGNDASGDKIVLQAPGDTDIIHQKGATGYPIPHTTNTNGSVGGTTTPVYVDAGVIKAGTALKNLAYKDSLAAADIPNLSWNKITSDKPTTLSGYGITDAKIASGVITLGSNTITPVTSVNGHTGSSVSVTAADLGLSKAMRFIGVATVAITDGSTTDPVISGYTFGTNGASATAGDVIIDKDSAYEYVWSTTKKWERLGGDSSYKVVQTAVSSATAETTTATTFVHSVTQDSNGVITVKTRPLPTYNNYSHPTGDGNKHVPANGTSNNGKFLQATATAGSYQWASITKSTVGLDNVTNDKQLPIAGGTLTGAVNTANNTWNKIGDDVQIGDINEAGTLGVQGLNGNTGIRFTTYNQATKTTGGKITWDGSKFSITSTTPIDASISGNAATATTASSVAWANVTGKPSTFSPSAHDHNRLNGIGRLNSSADAIAFNTTTSVGNRMSWCIYDSTSRSKDATNSPSFDASVINMPWDWGAYITQIAVANAGTRIQIRGANNTDHGENANPRYTPVYGAWREVVTATKATKIGDTNKPVYISNTGEATAISYTIEKSVPSNAVFTDHYAWSDITNKPLLLKYTVINNSTAFSESGTAEIFGTTDNTNGKFAVLRMQANSPESLRNNYASGVAWKGGDTYGMISVAYGGANVKIAGGNGTNPVWWFQLNATSGKSYTFPADSKTLAASDGSNASGTWGISISGNAATATKLSNTPNNTTTFLRGDNTWSNILTNSMLVVGGTATAINSSVTSGYTSMLQLVAGSGGNTNASIIGFHNPNISSASFGYYNLDANTGLFRYRSDDTYWYLTTGSVKLGTAWRAGDAVIGTDGAQKVVIGYLASNTNGVVIGAHNSALSAWDVLNVSGSSINFRLAETIRAKIVDGCLSLFPNNSSYREGLRIHSTGSWSDILLCGNDQTGDSGTSANSWFIGNNNGNFHITRNGADGAGSASLKCVNNVWSWNGTATGSISGNAGSATKVGISTVWIYPEAGNEINFGGTSTTLTDIYIGYRSKDSRSVPTKFIFGGSTGTADLRAAKFIGGSGNFTIQWNSTDSSIDFVFA